MATPRASAATARLSRVRELYPRTTTRDPTYSRKLSSKSKGINDVLAWFLNRKSVTWKLLKEGRRKKFYKNSQIGILGSVSALRWRINHSLIGVTSFLLVVGR